MHEFAEELPFRYKPKHQPSSPHGLGGRGRHRDRTGERYGELIVKSFAFSTNRGRFWNCLCSCGQWAVVNGTQLQSGSTKSCGHLRSGERRGPSDAKTHGMSGTSERSTYGGILSRCYNSNQSGYKDYGARGIVVCSGMLGTTGFAKFFAVIGRKPGPAYTVERIDNDKGYNCGKCEQCQLNGWQLNIKWAHRNEQARNKRNNHNITYNGVTKTITEWGREFGINHRTLSKRLEKGEPFYKAVTRAVEKQERLLTFDGKTLSLSEWARLTGISKGCISNRIDIYGWTVEDALTKTRKKQTTRGKTYCYNGKSLSLSEWSKLTGINSGTLYVRICELKWSVEKSLTTKPDSDHDWRNNKKPKAQ